MFDIFCVHLSTSKLFLPSQEAYFNNLLQGIDVLESTNLNYFTSELTAEFYGLKGFFFAKCGNSDDAQKSFSASVQLDDTKLRAWAQWGQFLEQVFLNVSLFILIF